MKKFKLIVPSFLAVIFCMLLIAGSTYAIFSSQSESSIAVTSGNIDVHADLSIEKMYTIQVNDGIDINSPTYAGTKTIDNATHKYEYVLTGSYEGQAADTKIYKMFALTSNDDTLGGANVTNSTLNLMNIAPGSKVELKLDAQNQSTIGIKYRLAIYANNNADAEMLSQMKLSFSSEKVGIGSKSFTGLNSYKTGWVEQAANVDVEDVTIIIELPLSASATGKSAGYSIVFESIQGNAKTNEVFDLVNKTLNESENVNNTMYDAYQEALAINGVDATNFPIASYLWNSVTDQFVLDTDVPASVAYQYFKVYESMPSTQKYSIFAADTWSDTTVSDLKVGFDVGNTSKITSINYDRSAASTGRTVIIRTNGGSLTINAPLDTVQHYGTVSSLNIIAVAGSSYHEYGSAGFAEIKTGRIVLEKESEVSQIHLTATDGSFNNIVVAKESTVDMPDFSRDSVVIPENGKLVVALQDGISEDTEKEYVWLTSLGLYEQVTISYSDAIAGENFVTGSSDAEQKSAAQQIANNIVVNDGQYSVKATKIGANWSYDLVDDTSTTVSGYTVTESDGNITITDNNAQAVSYNTENGMTASEKTAAVNKYNNCEARIGNTYYDTLEAAITAASLSEAALTITVLKDFQKSGSYVINNSLNIDGENHIVTAICITTSGNMAAFDMVDLAANSPIAINVKDLTINATGYARVFLLNGDYCEYTNPNVLNAANLNITTDGEAFYSNGPSTINVRNCTITHSGQYLSGKDPVYYSALVVGYNGTLNVYYSTISSFGNGAATFPSGGTINLYNTNITALNDFVDSSTGYLFWARHEKGYDNGPYTDYCGSSIINVYGGNYVGPYKVTDDGQTALNRIAKITIYEGTFSVNPSDYLADTSDVINNGNGTWTVTYDSD